MSTRTRNRSSSNALHSKSFHPSQAHHASSPIVPPSRPASASIATSSPNTMGMSLASRYAHNLKVLRRRDPSIVSIFDQFSHVCVYHHNGERWEKQGYEGSMFLYERDEYPPYGFFILNRMGMDDYVQRLYPEDTIGAHGSYLMLRSWPEWSKNRVKEANAKIGPGKRNRFDPVYKWDGDMDSVPEEEKGKNQTIGLWMFATDAREPMIDVLLKLHTYIKDNVPYPEEFKYGPDKPPPPNPHLRTTTQTPGRTPSAASTATTSSSTSSSYTSTSSVSTHSRNQSLNIDGPPKTNGKRRGKNQRGNAPGEETPKAPSVQLMSPGFGLTGSNAELDKLFAKLTVGSSSNSASEPSPSSSTSSGMGSSSLMAALLGGVPAGQPAITAGPTSTNKMTVESLFAALSKGSPADPKKNGQQLHSRGSSLSLRGSDPTEVPKKRKEKGKGKVTPAANAGVGPNTGASGLALLNDIFASAMDSQSVPEIELEQEQPEPIEVHSPIPTSSMRLPSILTLTQDVVDQLLGGGTGVEGDTMGRDGETGGGLGLVGLEKRKEDAVVDYMNAREDAESVRAGLMAIMGMGEPVGGGGGLKVPEKGETAGDVTPRGADSVNGLSTSFLPTEPHWPGQDEGEGEDDEDDGILELDFSDTRALSDMGVFETREREQTMQRAASRAASRSATPAVGSGVVPVAGRSRAGSGAVRVVVNGVVSPAPSAATNGVGVAKKPTRRGKGKGKDRAHEEESLSAPSSPSAGLKEVVNGHVNDTREVMKESLLDALFASASDRIPTLAIQSRGDLASEVVRLVQNDASFVDELWRGWIGRTNS